MCDVKWWHYRLISFLCWSCLQTGTKSGELGRQLILSASWKNRLEWKRNTCWAAWPQVHTKSEESFFVFTIFHKTIYASSRLAYTSALVLYLWRRDVEHFCDLGVQLLYVGESVDSARRTPVSQLGVEDEFRSWVVWRPGRWRWRRRQRRRSGLHTSLIRSLLSSFLFLHGLGPCCLLWAHSIPVLHQAPELRSR